MANNRPRLVHNSQIECVNAWLRLIQPQHRGEVQQEGWARGWYRARTLHFSGMSLYSYEDWHWTGSAWESRREIEIARFAQTPRGRWVVLVLKQQREWQGRKCRTGIVHWRTAKAGFTSVEVDQFEAPLVTQAWYHTRVQARYGKWQRARMNWRKRMRFTHLEEIVKERALFERLFGLTRTKEEPEIRAARVTHILLGRGD